MAATTAAAATMYLRFYFQFRLHQMLLAARKFTEYFVIKIDVHDVLCTM